MSRHLRSSRNTDLTGVRVSQAVGSTTERMRVMGLDKQTRKKMERMDKPMKRLCLRALLMLLVAATGAGATDIPEYMAIITGEGNPQSKAQVANRNVIELNNA